MDLLRESKEPEDENLSTDVAASFHVATLASSVVSRAVKAVSPVVSSQDMDDIDDDDDDEAKESKARALETYKKGLVFYKRTDPLLRSEPRNPTQIVLPNGKTCLGFPPGKEFAPLENFADNTNALGGDNNLLVFSSPGIEQWTRGKIFKFLLILFIPVDVILIISMYATGSTSQDRSTTYVFACCGSVELRCLCFGFSA